MADTRNHRRGDLRSPSQPIRWSGDMSGLATDEAARQIIESDESVLSMAILNLGPPSKTSLNLTRTLARTTLNITFPDAADPKDVIPVIAAARNAFQPFGSTRHRSGQERFPAVRLNGGLTGRPRDRTRAFLRASGRFGLSRLEHVAQEMISRTDTYHAELDDRHSAKLASLDEALEQLASELRESWTARDQELASRGEGPQAPRN